MAELKEYVAIELVEIELVVHSGLRDVTKFNRAVSEAWRSRRRRGHEYITTAMTIVGAA